VTDDRGRCARLRRDWPLLAVSAVAVAVVVTPSFLRWQSQALQSGTVISYSQAVDDASATRLTTMLSDAESYNAGLGANVADNALSVDEVRRNAYEALLDAGPGGTMGRLVIPKIGVDLGIRHGTDDVSLGEGVGHVLGSSLPVGGPGTNAVLAGHSGLLQASMLTDLRKLVVGDSFTVSVAGRDMAYVVDDVEAVLPDDREALQILPGHDYVTLVTCTPVNVNSHRLLVRGERVADPSAAAAVTSEALSVPRRSFPWWAVELVVGTAAVVTVLSLTIEWASRPRTRVGLRA